MRPPFPTFPRGVAALLLAVSLGPPGAVPARAQQPQQQPNRAAQQAAPNRAQPARPAAAAVPAAPAARPPAPAVLAPEPRPAPAPAAPNAAFNDVPLPTTFATLPEGGWRLRGPAGRGIPEGRDAQALGRLARVLADRTTGRVTVSARVSGPADDAPVARRESLAVAQAVKRTLEAGGLPGTRIDLRPLGRQPGAETEDSVDLVPPAPARTAASARSSAR